MDETSNKDNFVRRSMRRQRITYRQGSANSYYESTDTEVEVFADDNEATSHDMSSNRPTKRPRLPYDDDDDRIMTFEAGVARDSAENQEPPEQVESVKQADSKQRASTKTTATFATSPTSSHAPTIDPNTLVILSIGPPPKTPKGTKSTKFLENKEQRFILPYHLASLIPTYNDQINSIISSPNYLGERIKIRDPEHRAEEPLLQTFQFLASGQLPGVNGLQGEDLEASLLALLELYSLGGSLQLSGVREAVVARVAARDYGLQEFQTLALMCGEDSGEAYDVRVNCPLGLWLGEMLRGNLGRLMETGRDEALTAEGGMLNSLVLAVLKEGYRARLRSQPGGEVEAVVKTEL